jgi:hypothetical protein
MNEPIAFPAGTPRLNLPLLFAGQSQKEFFVNQSLTILDALAPGTVMASLQEPPETVEEGDCYRVMAGAAGSWADHIDQIALRVAGSWHFVPAAEGMCIFDATAGHWLCFRGGWLSASVPLMPVGGSTIDAEARAILTQLIDALRLIGILVPEAL